MVEVQHCGLTVAQACDSRVSTAVPRPSSPSAGKVGCQYSRAPLGLREVSPAPARGLCITYRGLCVCSMGV